MLQSLLQTIFTSPIFDKLNMSNPKLILQAPSLEELLKEISQRVSIPGGEVQRIKDLYNRTTHEIATQQHPNPLNRCAHHVYSQADEDGITMEIIRRIGIKSGIFVEIGVETGAENNSLVLAALGWRGLWLGNEDLCFDLPPSTPEKTHLTYTKTWITLENLVPLIKEGLNRLGTQQLDLLSLDLDGNDAYFFAELLKNNIAPQVFILEYNAKFKPPIRWSIDYDPKHTWQGDDYMGASLQVFCDIAKDYGYFLVCCNTFTGANAFFVHERHRSQFTDIPSDILQIWAPPRYYLMRYDGHRTSPRTLASICRPLP